MRNLLLLSFLIAGTSSIAAQAPAAPAKGQGTGSAPAARSTTGTRAPAAAASARSGIAMTVTDMRGAALPGVTVELTGLVERRDQTNPNGQVNFSGLQAGTYRLRFSGDTVTAFEREVNIAAGKTTSLDISLNPAPPPKEIVREIAAATPPPPPPAAIVGPAGSPQTLSLYDTVEKALKQKQPEDMLVSCSGNLRSTIVYLVGKDQPRRLYDSAEASFYVLGGDAVFRIGEKETALGAGGYVAIPRGVPFSISRRGNKSVELLALLSGAPCEEAK